MSGTKFFLAVAAIVALATPARAQTAPVKPETTATSAPAAAVPDGGQPTYVKPETPEQRQSRLGTVEDPGLDPDPNKHYWRFGTSYHIEKFDRRWAVFDQPDPNWVRPFGPVNIAKELYQQNEKYVWVWMEDPVPHDESSEAATVPGAPTMNPVQMEYFKRMRPEYSPLTVPESDVTV